MYVVGSPLHVPGMRTDECVLSQDQYTAQHTSSSSSTTPAVLQALAVVPVVTMYVRVAGAQQEVEPRQHVHVQWRQTHNVGPHTRDTKHTAVAKAVAHTYHGDAYVPTFGFATPPGH